MHNSLQILLKNLELAGKELDLADTVEKDMADYLIGDSLENIVSAFDGFGREVCRQKSADIHFQNLTGARRRVHEAFGFDFADVLNDEQWEQALRTFQKRHLVSHKMGVVDEEYVRKSSDLSATIGRRLQLAREEVVGLSLSVEKLGRRLFAGVLHALTETQNPGQSITPSDSN